MKYTYKKEKNFYHFYQEGKVKPYSLDVNTGILYGLNGKPISRFPTGLKQYWQSYSHCSAYTNTFVLNLLSSFCLDLNSLTEWANRLKLCDRIDALNTPYLEKYFGNINSEENINYIIKNFSRFAKKVLALEGKTYIRTILIEMRLEDAFTLYKNYPEEVVKAFFERHQVFNEPEKNDLMLYYAVHGLIEYHRDSESKYSPYEIRDKVNTFFNMCEKVDIKPKKEDFFKQYVTVAKTYRIKQEEINNEKIKEQLNKHNWNFEDENFIIIVPQTSKDFEEEAKQQSNCVFSSYLNCVINKETNIVFIRKKNNITKSYITCEITNRGLIRQFLFAYNRSIEVDTPEYNFYQNFQKWLNENWES